MDTRYQNAERHNNLPLPSVPKEVKFPNSTKVAIFNAAWGFWGYSPLNCGRKTKVKAVVGISQNYGPGKLRMGYPLPYVSLWDNSVTI